MTPTRFSTAVLDLPVEKYIDNEFQRDCWTLRCGAGGPALLCIDAMGDSAAKSGVKERLICVLAFEDPSVKHSDLSEPTLKVVRKACTRDGDIVGGVGKIIRYCKKGEHKDHWLADFGVLIFFDLSACRPLDLAPGIYVKVEGFLTFSFIKTYGNDLEKKKRILG